MLAVARHLHIKSLTTPNPRQYLAQVAAASFADVHELAACILALYQLTGQLFRHPDRPYPRLDDLVPLQWAKAVELAQRFDPALDDTSNIKLGTRHTGGKRTCAEFRDSIRGSGPSCRTTGAPLHALAEAQVRLHDDDVVRMQNRRDPDERGRNGIRMERRKAEQDTRQYTIGAHAGIGSVEARTRPRSFASASGLQHRGGNQLWSGGPVMLRK